MAATAVIEIRKPAAPKKAKAKKKKEAGGTLEIKQPASETLYYINSAAKRLVTDNYSYRDAIDLLRLNMLLEALRLEKGNKKAAGERLGISRNHVREYYKRGVHLVRPD
jgi:DNA-binding NtrC family response regulator